MKFEQDGDMGITFQSFNCVNGTCNFTVYFDNPPFEKVSEYNLQFNLNNKRYTFESTTSEWTEYVTHNPLTTIKENDVEVIQFDYYIPFQHDPKFFENFVIRIMSLKAFL